VHVPEPKLHRMPNNSMLISLATKSAATIIRTPASDNAMSEMLGIFLSPAPLVAESANTCHGRILQTTAIFCLNFFD